MWGGRGRGLRPAVVCAVQAGKAGKGWQKFRVPQGQVIQNIRQRDGGLVEMGGTAVRPVARLGVDAAETTTVVPPPSQGTGPEKRCYRCGSAEHLVRYHKMQNTRKVSPRDGEGIAMGDPNTPKAGQLD